ncbi:MAG: CHRD domain-containing protein [Alphaproteobacteria bacterium]|nr:CHRD domain-containing protein [Alphaproteobacteria bacterium]
MRQTALALGILACGLASGCMPMQMGSVNLGGTLNGASEVPPTRSVGTGSASAVLTSQIRTLTYTVQYSGLTGPATAAHFHCPADPGANAGVAVPINGNLASPIQGSATLGDSQIQDFLNNKCYVNIHTQAYPGGEIRGQMMRMQ